jgi:hypothetical protein
MRADAGIFIIICLLFLVGTVGAAVGIPDKVTVTTSKEWTIANNADQSSIEVLVENTTLGYDGVVEGVTINLAVDPLYGTLSPTTVITNSFGKASGITFQTNKKSGAPQITATIPSITEPELSGSVIQKIDHDTPYFPPSFEHAREGTVRSEVPFRISFADRWGNVIDDLKPGDVHTVQLLTYGPDPDDGGFVEAGYNQTYSHTLDSEGNLSVHLKLTSTTGTNYILVTPQWAPSSSTARTIESVANGIPFRIAQLYDPPGTSPSLPADGVKKFTIKYVLYDQYDNPTKDQAVTIHFGTEKTEEQITNSAGELWTEYGPSDTIKDTIITATAVNNLSVTASQTVSFYNQHAQDFTVEANPKVLASSDANPQAKAYINAKVMDGNGFPVINEPVSFEIKAGSINPSGSCPVCNATAPPTLAGSANVITDAYGNAAIALIPGAFIKNRNSRNYTGAATGSCTVSATWNGITKDSTIVWKNYPYLTVTTNVSPKTVNVSEPVDVRILLNGDGFGYSKRPVDVALVIDRSGSMGDSISWGGSSKLSLAKTAAKSFVSKMDNTTDQIAVLSYAAGNSGTGTRVDIPLSSNFNNVNTAIDSLGASGATETRIALKTTIDTINASRNPNPKGIQVLILLTDGDYNWMGNPVGRGTGYADPYDTFSTSAIEPNKYHYFDGLGGTLTPYDSDRCSVYSTTQCDQYSSRTCDVSDTTRCDDCDSQYTPGTGVHAGQCQWTNGNNHDHNYYTPATKPSSCDRPHCSQWHCNTWHCNAFEQDYLCTDGYDTYQNMANYAKYKYVRIYSIGFANGLSSQAVADMKYLAESTGGFYRNASSGTDLTNVYNEIAGDLKNEAAVNTTMGLDYGTIRVNNIQQDGFDVFSYVYDPSTSLTRPGSTWINKFNKTSLSYASFPYTVDDTANWTETSKSLNFDVGTIKLNETWETNFRLKVLMAGDIQIFGPTSVITFTDSMNETNSLTLPNTSISASEVATGTTEHILHLQGLQPRSSITNTSSSIPMEWTTIYDGVSTVTEEVSYSYNGERWNRFDLKRGIQNGTPAGTPSSQTATLDISGFPAGSYQILVRATAIDAAPDTAISDVFTVAGGASYIQLS